MLNIYSEVNCHGIRSENVVLWPTDSNRRILLVFDSEDRWGMESECVFYELQYRDGECLCFGYKAKEYQMFLTGYPLGVFQRRIS